MQRLRDGILHPVRHIVADFDRPVREHLRRQLYTVRASQAGGIVGKNNRHRAYDDTGAVDFRYPCKVAVADGSISTIRVARPAPRAHPGGTGQIAEAIQGGLCR